ncbi:MAG: leucyl aminopeptidase [Bacillota bacterium]|nr:leucyl aminopeptidase [Bacillota bacterium]
MAVEIGVLPAEIQQVEAEAVVVNLFQGVKHPGGATGAVDRALEGAIERLIAAGDFRGQLNETAVLYTGGKIRAPRVILVGLGEAEKFDLEKVRQVSAASARRARELGVRSLATIVHGAGIGNLPPREAARAVVEGALLGLYEYREYKSPDPQERPGLEKLLIAERDPAKVAEVQRGAEVGRIMAEATNRARDLANRPANHLAPADLAELAEEMAQRAGLECQVLRPAELERLGMEALLAVARGSHRPPRFIILRYEGDPRSKEVTALIGKGVVFDAGGISLKPGEGMHEMRMDKSGAAAVLGAMEAIARLRPRANVMALIPAVENLPGGDAQRPGDVVKTLGGKTVEVLNTDAEGRLILADAISYAVKRGATRLVDVATLTGAIIICLGHAAAGLFTNHRAWADEVRAAAEAAGERVWELPLFEEYEKLIKGEVADLKNIGPPREAGSIVGALFLKEFAGQTPWVHLDIAGVAWGIKEVPYQPATGATGAGTRTLIQLFLGRAEPGGSSK